MARLPGAGALARLRAAVSAWLQFCRDAFVLQRTALTARFRLYDDWRSILRHAWSIRLALVAALLSALEVVCSVFTDNPPIERGLFAAIAGAVTLLAALARLFAQSKLGDDR